MKVCIKHPPIQVGKMSIKEGLRARGEARPSRERDRSSVKQLNVAHEKGYSGRAFAVVRGCAADHSQCLVQVSRVVEIYSAIHHPRQLRHAFFNPALTSALFDR